jgi:quercetin dioxygenase-like cupin family protein
MPLDPDSWRSQAPIRSERVRATPLVWKPGADWFDTPWTGPTPHLHDHATEIGYLAAGRLELTVGGSTRALGPGDFVVIPPDRHHACRLLGDESACFFIAVAPDHRDNRLRQAGFLPINFTGAASCTNLAGDTPLPSNQHFRAERLTLAAGETRPPLTDHRHERILYVVSGAAEVRIARLAGALSANEFTHIPASAPHVIANVEAEPLLALSLVITAP